MARNIEHKLTDQGLTLISKCLSLGVAVNFTHAQLGTGIVNDEVDLSTLTTLITPFDTAALGEKTYQDTNVVIPVQYMNTNVEQVVNIEEIGLFAQDPETKQSVLVSYTTFGAYPDKLLPSAQTPMLKIFDVIVNLATGTVVEVTIVPTAMLEARDATDTPQRGKLLRVNENGLLPASITGDAATLGGKAPAEYAKQVHEHTQYFEKANVVTAAAPDKVLKLDANGKLPASVTGDAATLGGKAPNEYASATHGHANATVQTAGFMAAADKASVDQLAARVNQSLLSSSAPTFAGLTVNGVIKGAAYEA